MSLALFSNFNKPVPTVASGSFPKLTRVETSLRSAVVGHLPQGLTC